MDQDLLTPLAEALSGAYLDTASYSRDFRRDNGRHPTTLAKVHHLRSVTLAVLDKDDRYTVADDYQEFGRIQVTDKRDNATYLLRSDASTAIERATRTDVLFDSNRYLKSDVLLLVYNFQRDRLELSIAGTRRPANKSRLEATGVPTLVGTWAYGSVATAAAFDQEAVDAFEELGELGDAEDEAES